jgi:hypothetical protein
LTGTPSASNASNGTVVVVVDDVDVVVLVVVDDVDVVVLVVVDDVDVDDVTVVGACTSTGSATVTELVPHAAARNATATRARGITPRGWQPPTTKWWHCCSEGQTPAALSRAWRRFRP